MISVFAIIVLIIAVYSFLKATDQPEDNFEEAYTYFLGAIIFGIVFIILLCNVVLLTIKVETRGHIIDDKIAMLEEDNHTIEENLEETIEIYLEEEGDCDEKTITSVDNINDVIYFLPKLESNVLAQKQIQAYVDNKNKIKELKEERIDLSKEKWLLYFGR